MPLNYKQKMKIITYLADPSHWENTYDSEWVSKRTRGITVRRLGGGISKETDKKSESVCYKFEYTKAVEEDDGQTSQIKYKAKLILQKKNGSVLIEDESGVRIEIGGSDLTVLKGEISEASRAINMKRDLSGNEGDDYFAVEDYDLFVRFDENGTKTVIAPSVNKTIRFAAPDKSHDDTLRNLHKTHVAEFNLAAWDDISYTDFVNGLKLIVARDLGLEPDLPAQNQLSAEKVKYFLAKKNIRLPNMKDLQGRFKTAPKNLLDHLLEPFKKDPEKAIRLLLDKMDNDSKDNPPGQNKEDEEQPLENEIRNYIETNIIKANQPKSDLRSSWDDTTEFAGVWTATPRQFIFSATKTGFSIAADLDGREQIQTAGHILASARTLSESEIPDAFNHSLFGDPSPKTLFQAYESGKTFQDQRGNSWLCVIVRDKNAGAFAKNARTIHRENFGLDSRDFISIAFEAEQAVVAIRQDKFDETKTRAQSSQKLYDAIVNKQCTKALVRQSLSDGADLRYVDPAAARRGECFETLMRAHEDYTGLAALRDEKRLIPPFDPTA